MSKGCTTARLPAASYRNTPFGLPLVIAHGPKVVKPGWFASSGSVARTLATVLFDPPSIRYGWRAVIPGGLSSGLGRLRAPSPGALRRRPSYTETARVLLGAVSKSRGDPAARRIVPVLESIA